MPRRRRRTKGASRKRAEAKSSPPTDRVKLETKLRPQIERLRQQSETGRAALPRGPEPTPPPIQWVSEAELMQRLFEGQSIDFERIAVVTDAVAKPTKPPVSTARASSESPGNSGRQGAGTGVRVAPLTGRRLTGRSWKDSYQIQDTDPYDRPALEPAQRALLSRVAGRDVPTVMLRRMIREDALSQLRVFLQSCHQQGVAYARVVVGKGIDSQSGPVIKPAVRSWLQTRGRTWVRAWTPEPDAAGEWGALIVELWRRRR